MLTVSLPSLNSMDFESTDEKSKLTISHSIIGHSCFAFDYSTEGDGEVFNFTVRRKSFDSRTFEDLLTFRTNSK